MWQILYLQEVHALYFQLLFYALYRFRFWYKAVFEHWRFPFQAVRFGQTAFYILPVVLGVQCCWHFSGHSVLCRKPLCNFVHTLLQDVCRLPVSFFQVPFPCGFLSDKAVFAVPVPAVQGHLPFHSEIPPYFSLLFVRQSFLIGNFLPCTYHFIKNLTRYAQKTVCQQ